MFLWNQGIPYNPPEPAFSLILAALWKPFEYMPAKYFMLPGRTLPVPKVGGPLQRSAWNDEQASAVQGSSDRSSTILRTANNSLPKKQPIYRSRDSKSYRVPYQSLGTRQLIYAACIHAMLNCAIFSTIYDSTRPVWTAMVVRCRCTSTMSLRG